MRLLDVVTVLWPFVTARYKKRSEADSEDNETRIEAEEV